MVCVPVCPLLSTRFTHRHTPCEEPQHSLQGEGRIRVVPRGDYTTREHGVEERRGGRGQGGKWKGRRSRIGGEERVG